MRKYTFAPGEILTGGIREMIRQANLSGEQVTSSHSGTEFVVNPGDGVERVEQLVDHLKSLQTQIQGLPGSSFVVVIPGKSMTTAELRAEMEKRHLQPVTSEGLQHLKDEMGKLKTLDGEHVEAHTPLVFCSNLAR